MNPYLLLGDTLWHNKCYLVEIGRVAKLSEPRSQSMMSESVKIYCLNYTNKILDITKKIYAISGFIAQSDFFLYEILHCHKLDCARVVSEAIRVAHSFNIPRFVDYAKPLFVSRLRVTGEVFNGNLYLIRGDTRTGQMTVLVFRTSIGKTEHFYLGLVEGLYDKEDI